MSGQSSAVAGFARWAMRLVGVVVSVLSIGCGAEPDADSVAAVGDRNGPLVVYTVHDPLAWMAERIGGELVSVHFPAPGGIDPADWFPEPEIVARYQQADLVLRNGADYAGWIDRASLLEKRLIDTGDGFRDRWIPRTGQVMHSHGPEGDHSHTEFAFTFWLDPDLALAQARAVHDAFVGARPEYAAAFGAGLASMESELQGLGARLRTVAARFGDAPLLFSHPVYGYFERAHGLNGRSLHWEPDVLPSDEQWQRLAILQQEHPARLMIWEDKPAPGTERRLGTLGIESVVFAPAANPAGGPRYGEALSLGVAALKEVAPR